MLDMLVSPVPVPFWVVTLVIVCAAAAAVAYLSLRLRASGHVSLSTVGWLAAAAGSGATFLCQGLILGVWSVPGAVLFIGICSVALTMFARGRGIPASSL